MMKNNSRYIAILIVLLILLANIASAEDPAANAQVSTSLSSPQTMEVANVPAQKTLVIADRETKRYYLAGMPSYHNVNRLQRVYFLSEREAIDNGYYKAGTGKDLISPAAPLSKVKRSKEKLEPTKATRANQSSKPWPLTSERHKTSPSKKDILAAALARPEPGLPKAEDSEQDSKIELSSKDNTTTAQRGASFRRYQTYQGKPHRLEASLTYEYLSPHETYGDWNSANIAYYQTLSPTFTYFVETSLAIRPEGNGVAGTVGAYKDWTSFLSTYSAVSVGSKSEYLPAFRADHDFNFKVDTNEHLVLTAGVTYIKYANDHFDFIVSGGPTFYWNKWVLEYRLFHNESNPGAVVSYSHLVSAGYGEDGWQWTYLNISFGKQAYLATEVAMPETVSDNSLNVALLHRHWLGKHYGIFGEASFFRLEEGYDKYGITCGVFYEF
jgi:YaiO family outer membrane protein